MSSYSLDILTPDDALYVPFAKSLLDRAKAYMRVNKHGKFFTKWYAFEDVTILIRIWPEGEYIQIRAGKPGDFLVMPFVKKISTVTTTDGPACFLNGKLTKATEATDFVNANGILIKAPQFRHNTSLTKASVGRTDSTNPPIGRGLFKKQAMDTKGASSLANYAGAFKHGYVDSVTHLPLSEFLHARATIANPTTNAADGLYYNDPALGDRLIRFLDFSIARRPAVHESMFVSLNGKQIVTEEQFMPGNTLGFAAWFIVRSIIDVDLGTPATPVTISDYAHVGVYPAATFEARGSGTITANVTGSNTTVTGTFTYPVSTAFNAAAAMVHTQAALTYDNLTFEESTVEGAVVGPGTSQTLTSRRRIHRKIDAVISREGMASVSLPISDCTQNVEFTNQTFYQGGGTVPAILTMLSPLIRTDLVGTVVIEYSDAYLPALIYSYTTSYVAANPVQALSSDPVGTISTDIVATAEHNIKTTRNVAIVGTKEIIISDETSTTDTGSHTYVGARTGAPLFNANAWEASSTTTLPNAAYPNILFCPNRGLAVARTPARQTVQFAAQSKKAYIGSALLKHDPANPSNTKWYTFSHADAALKKTIVNFVLAPGTPIEGAALDDYEIWFTAIRAI